MCLKLCKSPCDDIPHAMAVERDWVAYNEMGIDFLILVTNDDDFKKNLSEYSGLY